MHESGRAASPREVGPPTWSLEGGARTSELGAHTVDRGPAPAGKHHVVGLRAPPVGTAPPRTAYLAVLGHTNLDVQLHVSALPRPGESRPVLERRTVWGGTAANIARHAAGLGVPTRLWSRVGSDFPDEWRAALEADGVDLVHLVVAEDAATPTCFILTDRRGQQSYAMDQGAMRDLARHPAAPAVVDGVEGWLHVATGAPEAYWPSMDAARAAGIGVAFDPGQELRFSFDPKRFERTLDRADTVFLNETEMRIAFEYLSYGDPVQLLDHVDAVVATHGARGATLYTAKGKPQHEPSLATRVVDPTGAGDAVRAGWYAALRDGRTQAEALRWGMAAAAVVLTMVGPQPRALARPDIDQILAA